MALIAKKPSSRPLSRRNLLKVGAGGAAALALLKTPGIAGVDSAAASAAGVAPGPLAWVWRFKEDGSPEQIRSLLAAHGVGVLLKVFDGVNWMAKYDSDSPMPMRGPESIRAAGRFFESAGVPFHAWCVVNGEDPIREAQMASMVLETGVRTLTFDLELPEGGNYWQTGAAEAQILGAELRRLQPNAYLTVAPDARPWQVEKLPMAEFAAFCNDIAPQTYWAIFDSPANHKLLAKHGYPVGPEGVTPELILDSTMAALRRFGKPIRPVGEGASDRVMWERFAAHAARLGMQNLSTWRVGTTAQEVWPVLGRTDSSRKVVAPPPEPPAASAAAVEPRQSTSQQIDPSLSDSAGEATESKTSSSRSKSGAEWHNRLVERLQTVRPFGVGGAR